jgi:pimeloyl-ACP methyl ester carboxylesterase
MQSSPPGRLVDIGTHRLHLQCAGEGRPAVVFDAALGGSSLSWTLVQPDVARVTTTCSYDRAGFGWSDAGPPPRTAGRIADELHAALRRAGIAPPYLLVGHSFGGLVARLFAARHRDEVAGLVLIEPAIVEDWADPSAERQALIARGTRLCGIGSRAARLGIARAVALLVRSGALAPARALVALVSRRELRREDEGILAPIWKLPPAARRRLGPMWTQPKFFDALGGQIAHVCDSAAEVLREAPVVPPGIPLTVITAAAADPTRLRSDAELARSASGRHVLVSDSGHWVPLDQPAAVARAVVEDVEEVRRRAGTS